MFKADRNQNTNRKTAFMTIVLMTVMTLLFPFCSYAESGAVTADGTTADAAGNASVGNIKEIEPSAAIVASDKDVDVKKAPDAESETIGTVNGKDKITVTGKTNESDPKWYEIEFKDTKGYIPGDNLSFITVRAAKSTEDDFEAEMEKQGFPESYKDSLRALHAAHPNWHFVADKTGLEWSAVLEKEAGYQNGTKVTNINTIHGSYARELKSDDSMDYSEGSGVYKSYDGPYVAASRDIIEHYLNPENFLDAVGIFQFISLKYDPSIENSYGLNEVINGTFLAGAFPESSYASYADLIMEAAKQSGVNPYMLASMIINEQGSDGHGGCISGTISGYEGYYNFFNIGAYPHDGHDAVYNGVDYAYKHGWNTRAQSIIDGAKYFGAGYVNNGQYTPYLKKFNVMNGLSSVATHQYMTNVSGAAQEGSSMSDSYGGAGSLVFSIPVFFHSPESGWTPHYSIVHGGWDGSSGHWRYRKSDGNYASGGIFMIDGKKYAFDANGNMVIGWYQLPSTGKWYYAYTAAEAAVDPSNRKEGSLAIGWYADGLHWFYFDHHNEMCTGYIKVEGFTYNFNSSGALEKGWKYNNAYSAWQYAGANGKLIKGWIEDNGKSYYLDRNYNMKIGWIYSKWKWYYAGSDGALVTGWNKLDGKWYYFDSSGEMKTGWIYDSYYRSWYHAAISGAIETGWVYDSYYKAWFYMSTSGAMETGWIDADGWYYGGSNGACVTGWEKIGGTWYYFGSNCKMVTGWVTIAGTWYHFDSSGAWVG